MTEDLVLPTIDLVKKMTFDKKWLMMMHALSVLLMHVSTT